MEWQGVYKRHLTNEEKSRLTSVVDNAYEYRLGKETMSQWLDEKDEKFLDHLFRDILYDYCSFKNIIFIDEKDDVALQPEKNWSISFVGVSPIKLDDLINDNQILYTECDREILAYHIVNKTSEIWNKIEEEE